VLKHYNDVVNALPGFQKVVVGGGLVAAHNGADHEALVALLTEDVQQAMKWKLKQPQFTIQGPPSKHCSEGAWKAMVPCKGCGKQIGWDDLYAHVVVPEGFICHLGCIPKGAMKL
jgi:hypothetical protein